MASEISSSPPSSASESTSSSKSKTLPDLFDMIYLDTTPAVDDNICKLISNRIKSKETTLVTVIEELGPRLTSTHVQERSKAVEILSHVFTHLPPDFLSETELLFIVDFLCDRCKDQHLVMPKIMMCSLPIVKCKNLPKGYGGKLLDALFREANVQSHVHKIRNIFFKTVQILLGNRLEELQNMSSDFIMNFLQCMDGEKDPRNLLLLFRIIPRVIANFKLDPFVEDFFEILSCYFPVDFNPSVSVPGEERITRKDLASALHLCLSQTNEFAEFLLPLVLEKLESSLHDAKMDSLELLMLCCQRSYLPRDLEPYLGQIWHLMRREIFMASSGSDDLEKKCYEFLNSAFRMIQRDPEILNTCLKMIYMECRHHLSEPELRLIMPTSNILLCLTEAGEVCCNSVVKNMFPVLYEQVCKKAVRSEKKRLLGIWDKLLKACQLYKDKIDLSSVEKWDEMLSLWFTLLTNDDWEMVTLTLRIFSNALGLSGGFSPEKRTLVQEHLLRLVGESQSRDMPQETKDALVLLSQSLCQSYGEEFTQISCPVLLRILTDSKAEITSRELSSLVLGNSSHLHEDSFSRSVSTLMEHLLILQNQEDEESLLCLRNLIQNSCTSSQNQDQIVRLAVRETILKIGYSYSLRELKDSSTWNALRHVTTITRAVVRYSPEQEQAKAVELHWNGKDNMPGLGQDLLGIPGLLVEAILGPLRPSVVIQRKRDLILWIMDNVFRNKSSSSSKIPPEYLEEFHVLPYVRLVASLLNKLEEENLETYLAELESIFQSSLFEDVPEPEEKMEVDVDEESSSSEGKLILALLWIVKSLAMRGYADLESWVDKVMKLLHHERFGAEVVKSFESIVADDPVTLNAESYCRFKFLYKQRLFLMLVDKLVSSYRSTTSSFPIQALSSQLKHIPSEVLFMKIDSVLPLLVASLKCNSNSSSENGNKSLDSSSSNSPEVLISSLNALMEMVESPDTKHKITDYCHDLIPQLSRLAQYKGSMDVRIVALKCLRKCASKAPAHLILPLRDQVVCDLHECLDDPKRLVRKEVALTRNLWILIGAPGGL